MELKKPVSEVQWQTTDVTKQHRRVKMGHSPAVIWLTGLPASGKTTIARQLEKDLHDMGCHTYILDGDNVRHGVCKDLAFSKEERKENIRRIAEISNLFCDAGIITICAFVSPYKEDRDVARELVPPSEFMEVFVKCPIEVCIERDPKSMYKKALAGKMKSFTGIDDPYEEPRSAELVVETNSSSLSECVQQIIDYMKDNDMIDITSTSMSFSENA